MAQRTQTRPRAHRAWGSGGTSGGEFSLKLCFFELSFKSLRRELASSNTLADRTGFSTGRTHRVNRTSVTPSEKSGPHTFFSRFRNVMQIAKPMPRALLQPSVKKLAQNSEAKSSGTSAPKKMMIRPAR